MREQQLRMGLHSHVRMDRRHITYPGVLASGFFLLGHDALRPLLGSRGLCLSAAGALSLTSSGEAAAKGRGIHAKKAKRCTDGVGIFKRAIIRLIDVMLLEANDACRSSTAPRRPR